MSIKSMTAFGSGEHVLNSLTYRCEVKTLNTRFIDVNVRLPRYLAATEHLIIGKVKKRLARGKIDVTFEISGGSDAELPEKINKPVLDRYLDLATELQDMVAARTGHTPAPMTLAHLIRLDGVLAFDRMSPGQKAAMHQEGLLGALSAALDQVEENRDREGATLADALRDLIKKLQADAAGISAMASDLQEKIYEGYVKRLDTLMKKLEDAGHQAGAALPEERLLAEVTILTDKSDIDEELTRISAHNEEFLKLLDKGGETGRRLDFLCQELHREVNTLSNKLTHLDVAQHTLSMKQSIERIRQQVQNIE